MREELVSLVYARAKGCCEYCRLPCSMLVVPCEIDHIIAIKHRGPTEADNLALACFYCNSAKGPNIAGRDPESGRLTRLFDPRGDRWLEHFDWSHAQLIGRTDVGRTTIDVLRINEPDALILRATLIAEGVFPPDRG
jgi:hypothetical protein